MFQIKSICEQNNRHRQSKTKLCSIQFLEENDFKLNTNLVLVFVLAQIDRAHKNQREKKMSSPRGAHANFNI